MSAPRPVSWDDVRNMLPGEVYRFPGGVAAGTLLGSSYPLYSPPTEPCDSDRLAAIERKVDDLLAERARRTVLDDYRRLTAGWDRNR